MKRETLTTNRKDRMKPTSNPMQLLTEQEVASMLRTSPRALRLWRRTRGLPHVKISSKSVLYKPGELDRWLSQHSVAITG